MSRKYLPLRIQTFTGFLPLWCGIATQKQARLVVDGSDLADDRFRAAHGVRSLSSHETMNEREFSSNPSDWLGPVWIVVNYFTWKALKNFGCVGEADELRDKTPRLLAEDLARHGSLNEYYNPDTGAAMRHAGFMDWNLLVLEMMREA
jgi:putative isomerase